MIVTIFLLLNLFLSVILLSYMIALLQYFSGLTAIREYFDKILYQFSMAC